LFRHKTNRRAFGLIGDLVRFTFRGEMTHYKEIRKRAKRSLAWVAVMSGVSEPTAKLFELNESAVANAEKRAALQSVYEQLRSGLAQDGERWEARSTPPSA
jgi:hypothetical protein